MGMPPDANGSTLLYRVETLEKNFEKQQDRVEERLTLILTQVASLHDKVNLSELKAQERDANQKQELANIQLRLFYSLLGTVGLIVVGIAIYYFTHAH